MIFNTEQLGDREVSDEGEQARGIESKIDLQNALKRLSERKRAIFVGYSEGYTLKELAAKQKISTKTAERELKSAKEELKSHIYGLE